MREVRLSYVQDWLMRGCVGPSGDECGSGVDCLSWSGKRATRSNCEASAAGHVAIHFRHFWGLWVGRSTFFITIAQMPVALTPSSPPSFNFFFLSYTNHPFYSPPLYLLDIPVQKQCCSVISNISNIQSALIIFFII